MAYNQYYPVATPGKPWGAEEKTAWRNNQTIKRSYQQPVLSQIEKIR